MYVAGGRLQVRAVEAHPCECGGLPPQGWRAGAPLARSVGAAAPLGAPNRPKKRQSLPHRRTVGCPRLAQVFERAERVPELRQGQLLSLVERWLREEQRQRQAAAARQAALDAGPSSGSLADMHLASWNNGWVGGRLASSLKHSANAVMRM